MPSRTRAGEQRSSLLRSCAGVDEGVVEAAFPPVQWGTCGLRMVGVGLGEAPSALCGGQLECDNRGLALTWKGGRRGIS